MDRIVWRTEYVFDHYVKLRSIHNETHTILSLNSRKTSDSNFVDDRIPLVSSDPVVTCENSERSSCTSLFTVLHDKEPDENSELW